MGQRATAERLGKAIDRRLREEFAKLRVEINEDKSRMVDLKKGESFTFLGFEYRRVLALFERLREIFRKQVSRPVMTVIAKNKSGSARLGELLSGRPFEYLFRSGQTLGRGEGTAAFDACGAGKASVGRGGVANGYMTGWVCSTTTSSVDGQARKSPQHDKPHNSWH